MKKLYLWVLAWGISSTIPSLLAKEINNKEGISQSTETQKPIENRLQGNDIQYAGQKAVLSISQISTHSFEVLLSPLDAQGKPVQLPPSDVLLDYPKTSIWSGSELKKEVVKQVGEFTLKVRQNPLSISISGKDGHLIQEFSWSQPDSGSTAFHTLAPVYGMGEGGAADHLDRRGFLHPMKDGNASFQLATHGAYIAVPYLIGADGWAVFFHQPINRGNFIDLRNQKGKFVPAPIARNQALKMVITCWERPIDLFTEYKKISGESPLPPKWSLGYMQSHRTLSGPDELFWVAHNMRERNLPCDALIYLGTGFTPTGWNNGHDSFDFNPKIFPQPQEILDGLKDLNFKVVLHNYSPPRGLHGESIENTPTGDSTDITDYWSRHSKTNNMGIDAWWADGGEGLSAESRLARHRMYYQGPLHEKGDIRPWSLHRTGYSGAQRFGGWIWSGDPDSRWKTLQTHIGVGLNHSASLSPYWGTDIGGFVPTADLTGELYIRWLQFAAFTPSFRGHGRTWHLRLPWGWNQGTIGPPESSIFDSENKNKISEDGYPYPDQLRNALIEPIARQYLNLRYQLLSYNYTLFREVHDEGIPPMQAMWIAYPKDPQVTNMDDQYMWGSNFLVAPVYEKGVSSRKVYLPEGTWYDFWTNEQVNGHTFVDRQVDLGTMPLYVPAGSIIPFDPVRQYTSQQVDGPLTIKIYEGKNGAYTLYEDDGFSLQYEQGAGTWTHIEWDDQARKVRIQPDAKSTKTNAQKLVIELLPKGLFKTVDYEGKSVEVSF